MYRENFKDANPESGLLYPTGTTLDKMLLNCIFQDNAFISVNSMFQIMRMLQMHKVNKSWNMW